MLDLNFFKKACVSIPYRYGITDWITDFMTISENVSIPYRYGITIKSNRGGTYDEYGFIDVSIPYRYGITLRNSVMIMVNAFDARCQFLIGTVLLYMKRNILNCRNQICVNSL